MSKKRLVLGVTIGGSSRLLDGQAAYFKQLGYEVYLISQDHIKETLFCEREGITHLPVTIDNQINPLKDVITFYQIVNHFRKIKPDIVNVGTFKMGLLGISAAYFCGIKNRIYTCRGLRFETEQGAFRKVLIGLDKVIVRLANKVIYVSPSTLKVSTELGIATTSKSYVVGNGSSNGVDIQRFQFQNINTDSRKALIQKYKLENKLVIGFVGRVSRDKGVYELIKVFTELQKTYSNCHLLLMGHTDCNQETLDFIENHPSIDHIPFQDDVPLYMSLFDIFVMSSWREGFPNVPIQAAAMGLPVVISDATGCVDAVQDKVNGLIYKCKNEDQLKAAIEYYILNEDKRREHGSNGCVWAESFTQAKIWNGINEIYKL
ncbi:MAG: glycosyltransferase family 4 protein [Flavobacterium sp.]